MSMTDSPFDGGATMAPIDPQQMADTMAEFFMQAAADPRLGDRLALADTTVHMHFTDDVGVTLHLDKQPCDAMATIDGTAEVQLWGSPELFMTFIRNERHMAMAIADGDLEYEGPVRKFLRIVPILRSFDFEVWRSIDPDRPS